MYNVDEMCVCVCLSSWDKTVCFCLFTGALVLADSQHGNFDATTAATVALLLPYWLDPRHR